jgi:hypothetical protein
MNEIRDLIIGIDFGKEYSQICYYDRKAMEALSLSMKVGTNQFETPTCICKRVEQGDYCVGIEAEYFAKEKNGILIENLYTLCEKNEKVQVAGEEKEPWELFAYFLDGMLKFFGITEMAKNTKSLVITSPSLNSIQIQNMQKACDSLGFAPEQYLFLDYGESFYYYALGQRETWNRSVGWYIFAPGQVTFRRLSMNGTTKPVLVKLGEPQSIPLEEEAVARDNAFAKFVQKTLGNELYSSIQITGQGFDTEWANQSVKLLCYNKRKVFYGNNLFAKGACMAGKERTEDHNLKAYRYMSDSLVLTDVGMEMRVMGAPTYYPLIEAGNNWYECKAKCEILLDDVQELVFVVSAMGDTEKKKVAMQLPGLPVRPNKTTRISLELQYISAKECLVTVEDLGFGEMYPSSGKVWTETVQW